MEHLAPVLLLFSVSFLVHISVWRIRKPANQPLGILQIHLCVLLLFLFVFLALTSGAELPARLLYSLHVSLFFLALTFVYIVTFLGTKDVGPSFLILTALEAAGERGLVVGDFHRVVTNEYLIDSRIREMLAGRLIFAEGDRFLITPKGQRYRGFYMLYRRCLGLEGLGG